MVSACLKINRNPAWHARLRLEARVAKVMGIFHYFIWIFHLLLKVER
jgi:hypothetical protein